MFRALDFLWISIFIYIRNCCITLDSSSHIKLLSVDQLQISHIFRDIANNVSVFIQKVISSLYFFDIYRLGCIAFFFQILLLVFYLLDDLISDLLIGSFDGCRSCRILLGNRFLIGSFCNGGISFLPCRYAGRIFCEC